MSDFIWAAVMALPTILALAALTGGRRPGQSPAQAFRGELVKRPINMDRRIGG